MYPTIGTVSMVTLVPSVTIDNGDLGLEFILGE